MTYREPGQGIEVRFLLTGKPFLVMPVTVVADGPDIISHYLADGTRYLRREAVDGSPPPRVIPPEDIDTVPTRMVEDTWRGSHRLIVTRPGQAHAVFLKWSAPEWTFREWYVNLQEPLRRTERGFDTRDHFLDIQVAPDRSWRWKDEDELALAVELGRLTRQQGDAIRREAESVIPAIEAGRFPFDDGLIDWRPEPSWPIARLLSGDELSVPVDISPINRQDGRRANITPPHHPEGAPACKRRQPPKRPSVLSSKEFPCMSRTLNLGVLAHVDAGKTSLTERILFHAGVIPAVGEVDRGTTQTDTPLLERQRGITIQSAVVSFRIGDLTVNLIDTPGHPDFIAEVERALGVLDAVVLVISAVEGVQPQTRRLSRAIANLGLPCLIFVNKIDRVGARNGSLLQEIAHELRRDVVLLSAAFALGTTFAASTPRDLADATVLEEIADVLCRHDDALLQRYVEREGVLHASDVAASLWRHSVTGTVTPVLFGSAMTGAGIDQLFDTLPYLAPSHGTAPTHSLSAEVFKVQRLPNGERVVIARIWAGEMCVRSVVPIIRPTAGHIPPTKITGIDLFQDGHTEQVPRAASGDIVRVHGLADARIGDWLGQPLRDRVQAFDPPVFEYRVDPVVPALRLAMNVALADLADGDPLIGLRRDPLSGDAYIRLYGEVQREVIDATLRDDHGVAVAFGERSVLHVERLLAEGRAAEIFGETGPPFYATVGFRIRPQRGGSSTWSFTPGKAKQGFFDAAEDGGRSVLEQGPYGWPVIDWDVEVTDLIFLVGAMPVDYRHLAMLVMADAIREACTVVCEPVNDVTIRAPAEFVGAVIHALAAHRGTIGDTTMEDDLAVVTGMVPAAETDDLARSLPGLTNGRADIESRFHDYVPVAGDPPIRPRTDLNPFYRFEFLSRLRGRF